MTSDLPVASLALAALFQANLAASLAIVGVVALRRPVRRACGAESAYRLWAAPPLAAAASLLPTTPAAGGAAQGLLEADTARLLVLVWIAGAVLAALAFSLAQARFLHKAQRGEAGPAAVGLMAPRVLMPADDGTYSPQERRLILAHERTHIERGDLQAGALTAAAQCLAWFNPLVHVAARLARLDQELACDAAVLRRHGRERAAYGRALLKAQMAGSATPPLGVGWGRHPLEVRIAELSARPFHDGAAGPVAVSLALVATFVLAWICAPPSPPPDPRPMAWERSDQPRMSVVLISIPPGRGRLASP